MRIFRLSRKKYAKELSGVGAARFGNRWNSKGTEVVYTAESRALAMAEVAVHVTLATLPKDYMMIEIDVPDSIKLKTLPLKSLKKNWNDFPHTIHTQEIGDEFIQNKKFCLLKVPSAVVAGDYNYIINPNHPEITKLKVVKVSNFPFDNRILK